jgi:hypothetical protein
MAKALDSTALYTYFRRLGFPQETQKLLMHIRSSPPSRTPGARRGNMPVWYPSKKMQCIIKAESTKVEFPFLLQAEHDDDVLEMWDQPPLFPWNTLTSVAASSNQCTPLTTLSFDIKPADGLNVNQHKNWGDSLKNSLIATSSTSKVSGDALPEKHLQPNMGLPIRSGLPTRLTGRHKRMLCF